MYFLEITKRSHKRGRKRARESDQHVRDDERGDARARRQLDSFADVPESKNHLDQSGIRPRLLTKNEQTYI